MKEMARILARAGAKPKRRMRHRERREKEREEQEAGRALAPQEPSPRPEPGRRLADAFREVEPSESGKPQSVYRVPDSWAAPPSVTKKSLPELKKAPKEEPPVEYEAKRGRRRAPANKRRAQSVGVSMSAEEASILRKYACDKGLSFSEWARTVLFKAAGKEIPDRP